MHSHAAFSASFAYSHNCVQLDGHAQAISDELAFVHIICTSNAGIYGDLRRNVRALHMFTIVVHTSMPGPNSQRH